jgi:hypothetical protein
LDIIQNNFDPAVVKDKLVLVGMEASGWTDYWVTPVSTEKMYGVEIHANALDTMLKGTFLQETLYLHTVDYYALGWDHVKPFHFYLGRFPLDFMPWGLFFPVAIAYGFARRTIDRKESSCFS